MKNPSMRVAAIVAAEAARQAAFAANDVEAFGDAVAAIALLDAQPDVYTCAQCGSDFEDGAHVDLLVCAIVMYGEGGAAVESEDYGILAVSTGLEKGRRFKICGTCLATWPTAPLAYANLR